MGTAGGLFSAKFEDMPTILPVFPLHEALLLPGGRLPLNIFEPRYLNMVLDALGAGRMIGMTRPLNKVEAGPEKVNSSRPQLYPLGCVGRITSFSETDDGRLLITLTGVSRFRIVKELDFIRNYRRVEVDFSPFRDDFLPVRDALVDRQRLLETLRPYFQHHGVNVNWRSLEGLSDAAIVTSVAMLCPFDSREKQALLEVATVTERAKLLIALIEMGVLEVGGGGGKKVHQ